MLSYRSFVVRAPTVQCSGHVHTSVSFVYYGCLWVVFRQLQAIWVSSFEKYRLTYFAIENVLFRVLSIYLCSLHIVDTNPSWVDALQTTSVRGLLHRTSYMNGITSVGFYLHCWCLGSLIPKWLPLPTYWSTFSLFFLK